MALFEGTRQSDGYCMAVEAKLAARLFATIVLIQDGAKQLPSRPVVPGESELRWSET